MHTCTWAPTVFQGPQLVERRTGETPRGDVLRDIVADHVRRVEDLGIGHLLIPQRWWGNGEEIEGSSLDCLAMTGHIATLTRQIRLITAIHPGFFSPAALAKWAATLDTLHPGRWAVNITSGWNLEEFRMYGIDPLDHDARYRRAREFIEVLRGAWDGGPFSHRGEFYRVQDLVVEPRPASPLEVFQGGQSPAAMAMAASHSDWMFLNGGRTEKLRAIIDAVRAQARGRRIRFAVYAAPLCRETDAAAWAEIDTRLGKLDPALVAKRKVRVGGATGMWAGDHDPLSHLDTNEGYCTRLIGSPATILDRIRELGSAGIELLHLDLRDRLFNEAVLPHIRTL
jgi:FMNH2-dependent dimethyl sulfone monooxygenase